MVVMPSIKFQNISFIRITYNQRPPKYFYNNETKASDVNSFEGYMLNAFIGKWKNCGFLAM